MARKLPAEERQRLLDELEAIEEESHRPNGDGAYLALLAIAGTIHSDYNDLSTNKYTLPRPLRSRRDPRRKEA